MTRRSIMLAFAALAVAAVSAAPAYGAATALPSGFHDTSVIGGLNQPTAVRIAPDGEIFIAEKSGQILSFEGIGDNTPTEFADLRKQVYDNGDRGLLGLALDPEYPVRPYVYALYTFDHVIGPNGDPPGFYPHWGETPPYEGDPCPKPEGADVDACPVSGRLVRLTDEGGTVGEEKVLVEDWCQQFSSHSIGDLEFGPEGALYASGGDGASFDSPDYGQFGWPEKNLCGDPPPPGLAGQELTPPLAEGGSLRSLDVLTPGDPTGLSGTVIRVDPETGEGLPDNPLASSPDPNARRIVAFGFRNPFRFAVDKARGELYVGNVGNATYEEIDRFPLVPETPYDSGWPCFEGPDPNPGFQGLGLSLCEKLYAEPESTSPPFFFFPHASGVTPEDHCPYQNGSAITGSAIYEGNQFPAEYDGALFFADSVRGCIYVIPADAEGELDPVATRPFLSDGGPYTGADIQVGPEGDLYYLSLYGDETLHRITYDPNAPVAKLTADKQWGLELPLTVHFDASGSTDPQEEELSYAWDLDGNGSFETVGGATKAVDFTTPVNRTITVRVEDETGATSVAQQVIYPGDTPPKPEIFSPIPSATWQVGQAINFSGAATAEEGLGEPIILPGLDWRSSLLHCPGGPNACHAHPLQVFPTTNVGTLIAPEHDYPSRIVLSLTATDPRGLSATKTIELEPRTVVLSVTSEPPGAVLTAGTLTEPGPFQLTAIEGGHISLVAPQTAEFGGTSIEFQGWSDGGARVHSVVANRSATYTAIYQSSGPSEPAPTPSPLGPAAPPGRPKLSKHPPKRTAQKSARFAFHVGGSGVGYSCKLDRAPFRSCRSPRSYAGLKAGKHTFEVRASADGVTGEAAKYSWTVVAGRVAKSAFHRAAPHLGRSPTV